MDALIANGLPRGGRRDTVFTFGAARCRAALRMDGYWIWCPSVIKGRGGEYHMFASRWPKWLPFHPGWMTNSEVIRAVADHPEGPYRFMEVVLPARGPQYWDGTATHNPTIRLSRDKYYLFYTGIGHPLPALHPGEPLTLDDPRVTVARSRKRVGIAWSHSLSGPWHRFEQPILDVKPDSFYSFLTSNPAPWIDPDGSVTMLFKARAHEGATYGPMRIGLSTALRPEGPYQVDPDALFGPDKFAEIEDPFLWKQGGRFRMIAKDMGGHICGQEGGGLYAESASGHDWIIGDPASAYRREIISNGGSRETVGSLERPFLLMEGPRITHLCAAISNGTNGFGDATDSWNAVLPVSLHSCLL